MEAKFCPFCQRKNKINAVRCEHCGVLLISQSPDIHTTINVNDVPESSVIEVIPCSKRIKKLPKNNFALFILDFSEPIIVPIQTTVILGRDDSDEAEENLVDFSRFGDVTLGISRKHAAIYFEDDQFSIEDLGSTNGTWINRHRLMPGERHPIKNDDQIWLGPLKIVFCLGAKESSHPVQFWLTYEGTGRKKRKLSPSRLTKEIGPYLEALIEIDHIRSACLSLQENEIFILSLVQDDNSLAVKLNNARSAVNLVNEWINPWREEHASHIGQTEIDAGTNKSLINLALKIVEELVPDLSPEDKAAQAEMLFTPLTRLATSPQNLSLEEPS